MTIAILGAGRLAWHLAPALQAAGHTITQVYSRTIDAATALATRLGAEDVDATDNLAHITTEADTYIVALADQALPNVLSVLARGRQEHVFLHTAGSVGLEVFADKVPHGGVLYPLQTFSKERSVDFTSIPVCIEGTDDTALGVARQLATDISSRVVPMDSQQRLHLHLAAVFACNFVNHCYDIAATIVERQGLDATILQPLIDETAAKLHDMHPHDAQTGPARRNDRNVMDRHLRLLDKDMPMAFMLYDAMSHDIHADYHHD